MYKIRNTVGSIFYNKVHTTKNGDDDDKKDEVFVVNDSWTSKDVAKHIVNNTKQSIDTNRSFTLLNIKHLIDQVNKWHKWMPRITPYYAVKCSNSDIVLEVLASLGVNFDCASLKEIQQILSIGVEPHRIIFAHTTKPDDSIKYAKTNNVNLLTFDSDVELVKIEKHHPSARLLIRIKNDAESAVCVLGNKFGCCPKTEAPILLQIAKDLQLNVVGVCFHVGSLCNETTAYIRGIRIAKDLFKIGSALGHDMKIIDIGGGFPGDSDTDMEAMAASINLVLDECFPPDEQTEIIAEPGRFFVSTAFTLACLVHSAKRPISMVKGLTDNVLQNISNNRTATNGDSNKENVNSANNQDKIAKSANGSNCPSNDHDKETVVGCDEIYKSISKFADTTKNIQSGIMYFLDNGIYGSFSGILWKRLTIKPEPLDSISEPKMDCSLWGPTCDGKDMICARVSLPPLPIPSWLIFPHFGAYTCTTSSNFNGYSKPLQYTFLQKSLQNYVNELPRIKLRNKIKWTEIRQHMPSQQNIDGDDIKSHLPFERLRKYRTPDDDTPTSLLDIYRRPNHLNNPPTYSSLYFRNLQTPQVQFPHQGISGNFTALRTPMLPSPSTFPTSSLLMPIWRDMRPNLTPNNVVFSSRRTLSSSITSPIMESIGKFEDLFAKIKSSLTSGNSETKEAPTLLEDGSSQVLNSLDPEINASEIDLNN